MQVPHRRAIALGDKRLGRPVAQEGLDLGLIRIELTFARPTGPSQGHPSRFLYP
jgi:hypothetical protein